MSATKILMIATWCFGQLSALPGLPQVDSFKHWIDEFNRMDENPLPCSYPNDKAWEFLAANVPLFSCPDREFERTVWFRWWTLRKHIKQTPDGWIVTEFLPKVSWAGKHNGIGCPGMHHFREARWFLNRQILDDYGTYWLRKGGGVRSYSFPIADSLWQRYLVTGDQNQVVDLLPELIANYDAWEKSHRSPSGLYWQIDDRDGMEVSIGGSGQRVTINSYQYGDALAIAQIAELAGKNEIAVDFRKRAETIRRLVLLNLWDEKAEFFKVRSEDGKPLADVRELHGFTPWYMNMVGADQTVAWRQLMDHNGFFAPCGLTSAERRHPKFSLNYSGHECQWNGPAWPFATSVTLTGLANLLNGPEQDVVSKSDYFKLLKIYADSHRRVREDGVVVPWIDENLHPLTGDWISRTILKNNHWNSGKGGKERGKDYNHSTFADLLITGLIGLRPREDNKVEVNPLCPENTWAWFSIDKISYHGYQLTITYDSDGRHFGKGAGLYVLANGQEIARSAHLTRVTGILP